jgi:hypothetical protein
MKPASMLSVVEPEFWVEFEIAAATPMAWMLENAPQIALNYFQVEAPGK